MAKQTQKQITVKLLKNGRLLEHGPRKPRRVLEFWRLLEHLPRVP